MMRVIFGLAAALGAVFFLPNHAQTQSFPGFPAHIVDLARQYNVIADGSTDQTSKVNQAITDANNAGGNVILQFPVGTTVATTLAANITGSNIWLSCSIPGACILKGSANNMLTWGAVFFGGLYNMGIDNSGANTNASIVVNGGASQQFINTFLGTGVSTFLSFTSGGTISAIGTWGNPRCDGGKPLFSVTATGAFFLHDSNISGNCVLSSVSSGRGILDIEPPGGFDTAVVGNNLISVFDYAVKVVVTNGSIVGDMFFLGNVFDGLNNGYSISTSGTGTFSSLQVQDRWLGLGSTGTGICYQFLGAGTIEEVYLNAKAATCTTSGIVASVTNFKDIVIDGTVFDGVNTANTGGAADVINLAGGAGYAGIQILGSRGGYSGQSSSFQAKNGLTIGAAIDHLAVIGNDFQGSTTNYNGMLTGTTTTFVHTNSKQRSNIGLADSPDISTFASRPANPTSGMSWNFSDGLAANCADTTCTTFGTNVTGGGGALQLAVRWNGTNWTLTGK